MSVPKTSLEVLVNRINQLPSLPAVVHHLIEATEDPDATIASIEEVIRADQSLTAKVLKLVNSAFFALRSRVSTLHHAAVILGLDALRNLALTVHTYEYLSGCGRNAAFDKRALWEHAAAVGIFAKRLAAAAKYPRPDEAFVAGLLHDLGKMILDEYFAAEFARALELCRDEALPLAACEARVLGFDHGAAGAEVGKKWRFPPQLVETIKLHHAPPDGSLLPAAVQLGDVMAKAWKIGASGDPLLHAISPTVWDQIPVDEAGLRGIVEVSREEITQVLGLFDFENDRRDPKPPATRSVPVATDTGGCIALVAADEEPFVPLKIYLEESGFEVRLVRPDQPFPTDSVVVWARDQESARRIKNDFLEKHPALESVPTCCLAPPCDPAAVVDDLRRAVPTGAPNR